MKQLYIHTIGCQMNVYDSEQIAGALEEVGYRTTESAGQADLIILNTCSIREKAEQKVFSFLGRLTGLKKRNPRLIIAVGGCVAQQEGRRILNRMPHVDVVFGTQAIARIPEIITRVDQKRCRIVDTGDAADIDSFPSAFGRTEDLGISRFVTIMRGCDNFCAYCVVPYVRGRETSRKPEKIIDEIMRMVDGGAREVTLLGQNVNSYGKKEKLCTFPELLRRIDRIPGLRRIRFTTSHPKDLSASLMECFGDLEKLCHHIHLPVQSGADRILSQMNRKYTRAQYLDKIDRLRRICPDIAVSSDFIVGFPGETADDFEQTLDLMREVRFDSAFAFKYSDRPSAPSSRFSGKLPEEVKNERLQRLLDLQEEISSEKHRLLVGTTQPVLVEGASRKGGGNSGDGIQWTGRTSGNRIVNFSLDDTDLPADGIVGRILNLKIRKAYSHSLWGEVC